MRSFEAIFKNIPLPVKIILFFYSIRKICLITLPSSVN
ncbi:hypothetical protein LPE509_02024 [Legionella pneumophila subsp. pneumophila LPE509]|nr:hypothetical protein LPE509_02024 [Legionella pneumophila subsp. pneumophila LPE509]